METKHRALSFYRYSYR